MPRWEEGSASLPPGVIYDWGHVNKNIKTIWASGGGDTGPLRTSCSTGPCGERGPARWYYARVDAPLPCSWIEYAAVVCFWEGWGGGSTPHTRWHLHRTCAPLSSDRWTILKRSPEEPGVFFVFCFFLPPLRSRLKLKAFLIWTRVIISQPAMWINTRVTVHMPHADYTCC